MKIKIVDYLDPESVAMIAAFYSRSNESIESRLEKLKEGAGDLFARIRANLKKFYINYGHASIADMGSTMVFIEDVSMLAEKAIEDNQLGDFQATSTRFIDFSTVEPITHICESLNLTFSEEQAAEKRAPFIALQKKWIALYKNIFSEVYEALYKNKPSSMSDNISIEDDKKWADACKARAFDVARGWLPAGVPTNVAWKTSLRKFQENAARLAGHPLKELKNLGYSLQVGGAKEYPNSFAEFPKFQEKVAWQENFTPYLDLRRHGGADSKVESNSAVVYVADSVGNFQLLNCITEKTAVRKKGQELSFVFRSIARMRAVCRLDFASYRDIHRHRSLNITQPILAPLKAGLTLDSFNSWYLESLPEDKAEYLKEQTQQLMNETLFYIRNLSMVEQQYYLPMGLNVIFQIEGDLPSWLYTLELRSGATVHPSLRVLIKPLIAAYQKVVLVFSDDVQHMFSVIEDTTDIQEVSIKRGSQDIVARKEESTI